MGWGAARTGLLHHYSRGPHPPNRLKMCVPVSNSVQPPAVGPTCVLHMASRALDQAANFIQASPSCTEEGTERV